jgi:hypothetical protein
MSWLWIAVACESGLTENDAIGRAAIVLVIDGVRTDELCGEAPSELTGLSGPDLAPALWSRLAPQARWSGAALNTGVTVTAPAHAALLLGRHEPYANFPMRNGEGPALYRPLAPTLFEELRDTMQLDEGDMLLLGNTELLGGLNHSAVPLATGGATWHHVPDADPLDAWPADDASVFAALRERIDDHPPRLAVVNLHDVDRAGHYGDASRYPATIAAVDVQITAFRDWIAAAHPDYARDLLLVVTSDHGRHRGDGADTWRNHGDACGGCREIPLFLTAPAVAPGELAGPTFLLDLTPTLAGWLGASAPRADGLPIPGVVDTPARTGVAAQVTLGGSTAAQVWRDTADVRSEVTLDGAVVSSEGALAAEAPVGIAAPGAEILCWRELMASGASLPWSPRCLADSGAGWQDIGHPAAEVSPEWRPAFAVSDGAVYVAWAENPRSTAERRSGEVGLALASWSIADGWSSPVLTDAIFPTDPTLSLIDGGVVVAFATSLDDPDSRYTRRVRVVPHAFVDGVPSPTGYTDFARDGSRFEHPTLTSEGATLRLGMTVIDEEGAHLEVVSSSDGGRTWSDPVRLPGHPDPAIPAAWASDALVWVERGDEPQLCRASLADTVARCIGVGSPRVRMFTPTLSGASVVIDAGIGEWAAREVTW